MIDGAVGLAVVTIVGFAVFIFWAKTASGNTTLRSTLGEPHSFRKRQRLAKRRVGSAPSRSVKSAKTTKRSPR